MSDEFTTLTFYFVSGQKMRVKYCNKDLISLVKALATWNEIASTGPEWGINFKHVTHYQIESEKDEKEKGRF